MNVPVELRRRLELLNDSLLRDHLNPNEAVWLACDLLVAGVETPAVVELACQSAGEIRVDDALPLVLAMLAELGVQTIDVNQPPWALARAVAQRMIDGAMLPEDGAGFLWDLTERCDWAPEITAVIMPLDRWWDVLPHQRDVVQLRAEMIEVARDVVRAADARLA